MKPHFKQLSLDAFSECAKQHKRVIVYEELSGDSITPISVFTALGPAMKGGTLLESSDKEQALGRYTFIGFTPLVKISATGNTVTLTQQNNTETFTEAPFSVLRRTHDQYKAYTDQHLPGFSGGMVGYLSYDAIRLFEKIPDSHLSDKNAPDLHFCFYQDSILFDNQTNKVTLATVIEVGNSHQQSYLAAKDRLATIRHDMFKTVNLPKTTTGSNEYVSVDIDDAHYGELVDKAKEYIKEGDIFQVVLSREFKREFKSSPFTIYRALRHCSPSPYMFYIDCGDSVITGASPEKLISVDNRIIQSCPLAGTRKRNDPLGDDTTRLELLSNEKETAEHMMLVDLARNDLGAVSKPGEVHVRELKKVKIFSHVMHISSLVEGELRDDKDALDALCSSFPAGTLTGAPKIRAMEIIDALEQTRRNHYGGAICFMDNHGNFDSCITIRMAFLKDNIATVRTGAGIVIDSDPQHEANETRHKASSVLDAIALAEEGL